MSAIAEQGREPKDHQKCTRYPWKRAGTRAELEGLRLHDLGHSSTFRARAHGEGMAMFGKLTGHTQVQTTAARYAHLARANEPACI